MENKIYPCLWMQGNAKEAALFYCSAFKDTAIIDENPYVVVIQSAGQTFMLLNGGPMYKTNPSISFFVHSTDAKEVEEMWEALTKDGKILMPLDQYPWSEVYGWVEDKFGVSWQISLGNEGDVALKFSPFLTFTNNAFGKAEEAVNLYTSIFPDSSVTGILKQKENPEVDVQTVLHAQFNLCKQVFMASDSGHEHAFQFGPGVSLVVSCASQDEIDHYWEKLSEGGAEEMCGWLRDRFGISWQVVPSKLGDWMRDPEKSQRVGQAFMQMKKMDWATLENA